MVRHALRWFAVALAVSLFGAVEGSHLLASLNDPLPAVLGVLHAHADAPPPRPAAPARRVVVVLIDGLGAEPFDARVREGALGRVSWKVSLDSGVPSRSRPVYHAILTGVPQWVAGIRSNAYAPARADSVTDRVRAGGGRVAWMLETVPWFYELFGAPEDALVVGRQVTSPEAFERVWALSADLTVLHLIEVDEAGHLYGAESDEYVAASRRAMGIVASFRALARGKPGGDEVVWFVGADHGHTARGGHGGPEERVRRVSWAVLDDGASASDMGAAAPPPGATVGSLAPTIARALGVDAPRESMADGLPLLPGLFGEPLQASAARVEAVVAARAAEQERFLGSPTSRATLFGGVVITTLVAMAWFRRRRGIGETMVSLAAIAGLLVAGPGLSMSSARTEGWYVVHAVCPLVLFAGAGWVVVRKWASPVATAAASTVFPALALVAARGSLGRSDSTPAEMVLWPSLALVPASVCAAIAIVEAVVVLSWRRGMSRGRGRG